MENRRQKILVVDDDEQVRSMYVELLRENGFEVIEKRDGVEGLEVATTEAGIDAIFTGIIMPRMNGFEFIKALKENKNTVDIPVIVNSHLGREGDRTAMEKLGINDFIVRGLISPAEVVKRIKSTISSQAYFFQVNKEGSDTQRFIREQRIPLDFCCDECATELAIKLKTTDRDYFRGSIRCPKCNKRFN